MGGFFKNRPLWAVKKFPKIAVSPIMVVNAHYGRFFQEIFAHYGRMKFQDKNCSFSYFQRKNDFSRAERPLGDSKSIFEAINLLLYALTPKNHVFQDFWKTAHNGRSPIMGGYFFAHYGRLRKKPPIMGGFFQKFAHYGRFFRKLPIMGEFWGRQRPHIP